MRPISKRAGVAAGAIAVVSTGAAGALAQSPNAAIAMKVDDRSIIAGQPARVSGRLPRDLAGRTVQLEFAPARGRWTAVATTRVGRDGRYRLARSLPRSGAIRVTLQPAAGAASASSEPPRSHAATVNVAPRVGIRRRRLNVKSGSRLTVAGRIAPATGGIAVSLQIRRGRRWVPLDRARTRASGAFTLRDRMRRTGSAPARVVVAPHRGLARGRRSVGRLNVFRVANASWYGPGFYGQRTGCGGRLGYGQLGVAHKSLPCGTKVTFRHRGRTVSVRVIDRGPYVAGREYDLTASTAQRLGFKGHGAILATR